MAGRAILVTLKDGDLVAFGIIVNETKGNIGSDAIQGVAMCENMQSTLQYLAFFTLSQTSTGNIYFNGMLRSSAQLSENDELMI
jgi:hypothetical protein